MSCERRVPDAYLGLGSNLGNRREYLRAALRALADRAVYVKRVSSLYETEPMYRTDQPRFLNAVIEIHTELDPSGLLAAAKMVEQALGRQPRLLNGPREIDVDVLSVEGQRVTSGELTLPHPRMAERPFVQLPLSELTGQSPTATGGAWKVEGAEWAKGALEEARHG